MRKIAAIFAIMSVSSSAFALSSVAITEALSVSKVNNITSVSADTESATPRCMCELVKITGTDASGNEVSQTVIVEHRGAGQVKVVGQ